MKLIDMYRISAKKLRDPIDYATLKDRLFRPRDDGAGGATTYASALGVRKSSAPSGEYLIPHDTPEEIINMLLEK